MYQSQVRPEIGRELVAQHQPKQHNQSGQVDRSATDTNSFPQYFLFSSRRARVSALTLVAGCLMAALSGCGGLTFRSTSVARGSGGSTTGAALSQISCGTQSLTGAQSKACSVYLSAPATSATTVALTSTNSALKVPASVVIAQGAKSTGFNAVSSSVSKSVSVTITGKSGGVTKTDVITVYPAPTTTNVAKLSKVSCGTLTLTGSTTKACSVYLDSAASSAVTITLSSSSSALKVPAAVTVAAGSLTAGFGATALAVTTTQTATITAAANGVSATDVIQLLGSGTQTPTQHEVVLEWVAPGPSSDPLVGYRVYRANAGTSSYQRLNSSVDASTTYTDTTVVSGSTYDYIVKSVDSSGVESAPSNTTSATIP